MAELRFLADMNISPETVRDLRKLGWKIARVSELMDIRASDRDILSYAQERTLIIVTQDLDFSALLAVGGHAVPSVIILRLADARPGLRLPARRDRAGAARPRRFRGQALKPPRRRSLP